jgi:chromosome segregation ATPase
MNPVSRQEVQNIVDSARKQIMDRTMTKQEFLILQEAIRSLTNIHQQNLQFLKQAEYQRAQASRRIAAVEARLSNLENDTKQVRSSINRLADVRQQIIMPTQTVSANQPVSTVYEYVR